ncbi:serine/threonine-protein kinase [Nocardia cyriacigeorgica]|uniref:serine/threonine-protein kinase n=1 Tax=Nocardia cyriacigeorgica TaxID=135487 RepID=UPI0024550512|nr:serine/threonine-protein kinase [Nocardia cyriacigeorgica]
MPLRPGAVVGGYRILQVLGSGGMGTVYLAQNPILPKRDALKVLSSDLSTDPEFRARFEREANLAAGLDHPNLVAVYSRGEEDGQLWIAMQYVDGTDASEEVAKGPSVMTPQRALRIVSEVGKGLDYAHRKGLLHRDVKPANFLLSRVEGDDEERVFLTDFGVAKSADDGQDLTATGNFMATVAYAPPEQLVGAQLDYRADIYSLACSFYKLLTGQNPFPSTMPAVVMMGHLHEPPPSVSAARPGLPPALDAVIAKAMAKSPEDRYGSCREFVQAAEAALLGQPQFQAPTSVYVSDPSHYAPTAPQTQFQYAQPTPSGDSTGPRIAATVPNTRTRRERRISGKLAAAAVAVVALIAIAAGTYFAVGSPGADAGPGLAQVRAEHPEFADKTVAAFNIADSSISAVLDGSDQAKFLQDIGFRYSKDYQPLGDEKSPRELAVSTFRVTGQVDVILAVRTDSLAGGGGLRGLPPGLMASSAKIVVIDDPAAVQAFQVWTEQSQKRLTDTVVPTIAKVLG